MHRWQRGQMHSPAKRKTRWFESSPMLHSYAQVVQLEDTLGRDPKCCRFESCLGHQDNIVAGATSNGHRY